MPESGPPGESWREMIERLRNDGVLDAEQETVLFRFFSDKEIVQAQALGQIAIDHAERVVTDGKADADAWLKDTATRMGRQDREDTQRMLASIGVETPPAAG